MRCYECGEYLTDGSPYEEENNHIYCGDCAFKKGIIDESKLLKHHYYFIDIPNLRAVIHDGEVQLGVGLFEWEHSSRNRESKGYSEWRKAVFKRDNFTCRKCGKQGGTLNAHHIKPYAKYESLRTDINNGITLCVECHKKEHKKERGGDLSQNAECSQKQ